MNPYTIFYTDGSKVYNNVWEGDDIHEAIDDAIDDLQLAQLQNKNYVVLIDETLNLEENN